MTDGGPVLYIGFEQSEKALVLVAEMHGASLDLSSFLASGLLTTLKTMPESAGAELHLVRILNALTDVKPRHLVVDAISACRRMGTEQDAFEFIVRLLTACKDLGITCLCTNQTPNDIAPTQVSGIEIASLMEPLISLEYAMGDAGIRRQLLVIKSRGAAHSMRSHQMTISEKGISLKPDKAPPEGRIP